MRVASVFAGLTGLLLFAPAFGQNQPKLEFETASAIPFVRDPATGITEHTAVGAGRVEFTGATLTRLMAFAFGIPADQIAGPDWMAVEKYNVVATLPQGAPDSQAPEMLQSLLAARFKLAFHRENREQAVLGLLVAEGGLKPDAPTALDPLPPKPHGARLEIPGGTMQGLAGLLTNKLERTVVDMTGLRGRYPVVLDVRYRDPMDTLLALPGVRNYATSGTFIINGSPSPLAATSQETTAAALQRKQKGYESGLEKLGLRLEPRTAAVEDLVIDHLDKMPAGN